MWKSSSTLSMPRGRAPCQATAHHLFFESGPPRAIAPPFRRRCPFSSRPRQRLSRACFLNTIVTAYQIWYSLPDYAHLLPAALADRRTFYGLRMKISAGSLNRELTLRTCSSVSFRCPCASRWNRARPAGLWPRHPARTSEHRNGEGGRPQPIHNTHTATAQSLEDAVMRNGLAK